MISWWGLQELIDIHDYKWGSAQDFPEFKGLTEWSMVIISSDGWGELQPNFKWCNPGVYESGLKHWTLHISTTEHEVLVICSALGVAREGLIIMEEITQWFIIIFLKKHGHNCFFFHGYSEFQTARQPCSDQGVVRDGDLEHLFSVFFLNPSGCVSKDEVFIASVHPKWQWPGPPRRFWRRPGCPPRCSLLWNVCYSLLIKSH